jgi:hypothetical protein
VRVNGGKPQSRHEVLLPRTRIATLKKHRSALIDHADGLLGKFVREYFGRLQCHTDALAD